MNVSISTNIFGYQDISDRHLSIAASAGFHLLDFCAFHYVGQSGRGFYRPDWRQWIDRLRKMADARGVHFNQTHNAVFNYFTPCETQALNIECVWRIIEATALLGAKNTVCHPIRPEGANVSRSDCLQANREFFLRASDLAAKFGVNICIENMKDDRFLDGHVIRRYCVDSDELLELLDSINRKNVKLCADTGHAHFMGETPEKLIRKIGSRLAALHIHDNDTWSDQHLLPFCGTICWDAVTSALADIHYTGDFTFEVQNSFCHLPPELFEENLRFAKSVGDFLTGRIEGKLAGSNRLESYA